MRVFAYVIRTVSRGYRLTGCVPWVSRELVLFGPCKKRMRPEIGEDDYIVGISPAGVGKSRRVLLWMRVKERITFGEAYQRGKSNSRLRAARGHAIHMRPKRGLAFHPGDVGSYEHIPGAPHGDDWASYVEGKRDVFLIGAPESWVAESQAPVVDGTLLKLLKIGARWKGHATIDNPLTENARGRHAKIGGKTARQIREWIAERSPSERVQQSHSHTRCGRKCDCE